MMALTSSVSSESMRRRRSRIKIKSARDAFLGCWTILRHVSSNLSGIIRRGSKVSAALEVGGAVGRMAGGKSGELSMISRMSSSDELTVAEVGMGCAWKNGEGGWVDAWGVDLVGRVSEAAAVVAVVTEVTVLGVVADCVADCVAADAIGVVEVSILEVGWEAGVSVWVCMVAGCIAGVEVGGRNGGSVDK